MADYITTREYADLHGLKLETVRTWTKCRKIAFIKVGDSIMIDRNEPIPERRKKRTFEELAIAEARSRTLKVEIVRAYHVAVIDGNGKEVVSDFTFGTKQEAEKLGEKLKREVEGRG
jgi:excisionase family DNA binding protein